MSQASTVISNASGAAARAAINSALEAITTGQSGATAPSPTYPYMPWNDTANDLAKQRNGANSAWITKGTLSAAYGGIPASSIIYAPGSPAVLSATDVQTAIDELAASGTDLKYFLASFSVASGNNGEAYTGAGWRTVNINTEDSDSNSIGSISSKAITLIAGTYDIRAHLYVNAASTAVARARLRNTTAGTTIAQGVNMSGGTGVANQATMMLPVSGRFVANGTDAFELQVYPNVNTSAQPAISSGESEVFALVEAIKIS